MWKRKSPEEIASQRDRIWWAVGGPLLCFFIAFLFYMVIWLSGPNSYRPVPNGDVTWGVEVERGGGVAVIVAIGAYLCQGYFKKPIFSLSPFSSKVLICNKCFQVKSHDGKQTCDCGGKFEDFELWKWVKDCNSTE